ncbi:unnamed protein product [Bursaphelenchus xylophilus]|uniref:ubiquitinyl hydrolase 1 n=1 Tax=Bursaphelenchus xylophilus TaxID=6326 RepID=A0A1I7RP38_BURXY|nr:unnamed protein product [Bursaphelenchus xylophilus]CAG9124520.1 unnamed protein product [Bursaphelenchus xylophilus]
MSNIFFEKQDGMLCAQHALNMLLQTRMYTAFDLGDIARQLDEREKALLPPQERAKFVSSNMDDTGFFSVEVIREALKTLGLEMIPLLSPGLREFQASPKLGQAYICNMNEHWFALRKLFGTWYQLDSMKNGPKEISEGHLDAYVAQLMTEGYSVFYIGGDISQFVYTRDLNEESPPVYQGPETRPLIPQDDLARAIEMSKKESGLTGRDAEQDELQRAIALSMKEAGNVGGTDEQDDLERAIAMSMQDVPGSSGVSSQKPSDDVERAIQASLGDIPCSSKQEPASSHIPPVVQPSVVFVQPPEPGKADTQSSTDDDLRQKRAAFLRRFD